MSLIDKSIARIIAVAIITLILILPYTIQAQAESSAYIQSINKVRAPVKLENITFNIMVSYNATTLNVNFNLSKIHKSDLKGSITAYIVNELRNNTSKTYSTIQLKLANTTSRDLNFTLNLIADSTVYIGNLTSGTIRFNATYVDYGNLASATRVKALRVDSYGDVWFNLTNKWFNLSSRLTIEPKTDNAMVNQVLAGVIYTMLNNTLSDLSELIKTINPNATLEYSVKVEQSKVRVIIKLYYPAWDKLRVPTTAKLLKEHTTKCNISIIFEPGEVKSSGMLLYNKLDSRKANYSGVLVLTIKNKTLEVYTETTLYKDKTKRTTSEILVNMVDLVRDLVSLASETRQVTSVFRNLSRLVSSIEKSVMPTLESSLEELSKQTSTSPYTTPIIVESQTSRDEQSSSIINNPTIILVLIGVATLIIIIGPLYIQSRRGV
ncbi:MAG: hypothetical protein QXG64_05180 [Acidilobaceae archaeon]